MGKESVFQQMMLRQLDIYMRKNEIELLPHTVYTIHTNWIEDLNVRAKTKNSQKTR